MILEDKLHFVIMPPLWRRIEAAYLSQDRWEAEAFEIKSNSAQCCNVAFVSKKEALAILPSHSNGFRDLCFSLEELTVDHFQKAGD